MVINGEEADLALLTKAAHKERSALTALYDRFEQPVFRYLCRFLDNRELAEDVLQEVMLVAWQKAHTFRGAGRVQNWMFGIAHNQATLALRGAKGVELALEAALAVPDRDPTPEDDAIQKATCEEIAVGLARLTPAHREVLELAFYQDFSCKEIAAIVDVPEGTVKSRLSYARRTLKAILLCQREKN